MKLKLSNVTYVLTDIGNGNLVDGILVMDNIVDRLRQARSKHPVFEGVPCITSEIGEFLYASDHESRERAKDEALDIIATCIRFLLDEDK